MTFNGCAETVGSLMRAELIGKTSGDEALVDLRVCNFTVFCCCHTYERDISTLERRKKISQIELK